MSRMTLTASATLSEGETASYAWAEVKSDAGDGQETEIGFNVKYLLEALRAVPSEEVTLELTNGLSPIVFTPCDKKYDFAYMVLPVRLRSNS